MNIHSLVAAAGLSVAMMVGASSVNAAPVGALTGAADTDSAIIKAHGCHRSCEWGPVLRWHRHVGPACAPVACWPRAANPNRCWVDWRGIRHCRW